MITNEKSIDINDNMALVPFCINKFIVYDGDELEDLYQVGYLGLLKASKTFIEGRGTWSTYAIKCIRNEILMYKRRIHKHKNMAHLSDKIDVNQDATYEDMLTNETNEDDILNGIIAKEQILEAYNELKGRREKEIVACFLKNKGTQNEVASLLGISQAQVSRVIVRFKKMLRTKLGALQ